MKKRGRVLIWIVVIIIALLAATLMMLPAQVEKGINKTYPRAPYTAPKAAVALHKKLIIADMHSDSLLWDRNLLKRNSYGHVDVPRLIEGNVALQAFTMVTKLPKGTNYSKNEATSDDITTLALVECWPPAAWSSLKERALYQAARFKKFADRSNGKLTLIATSEGLKKYLERRKKEPEITASILGIEGAHAFEGNLANLDVFFDAGIRMIGLAHFFDNDMSGSAHGVKKGGLSENGRQLIRLIDEKHMLLDLAHASPRAIDDALSITKRPVVVSHTGVQGVCKSPRNLSDDQIRRIVKTGGVICIGYWDEAVCGSDARAIARSIRYAVKIAGIDHVGLGSDYDGGTTVPFDTSGLVELTAALMSAGFSAPEIEKIMGGNVIRLLTETLP